MPWPAVFAGLDLLIVLGAFTALYGAFYAMFSNNIRRIVAYLMVAQMGFMITALGMDSEAALDGVIILAYAHTFYNALLFMAMGAVIYFNGREETDTVGEFGPKASLCCRGDPHRCPCTLRPSLSSAVFPGLQ